MSGSGLRVGSLFITGASRGIGLEFVKQLTELPQPPKHIFATCRNPDAAEELRQLASKHPNVHLHKLDVRDYASYPVVVDWVGSHLEGQGLNVLVNSAGIAHWQGFDDVTREHMLDCMETNAVVPLMMAKAFLPLLKKAANAGGSTGLSCARAAIVNFSTRMGSIDDNTSGGSYAYRTSKTAQNMVTKSMSVDLKPMGILAVSLHPGWVLTEMGGPNALIDAATSVSGLLKVMEGLNDDSVGRFISFKGEIVPW